MCVCAGHGRMHAAEQRKERESLEELIHSIQLESELTSRALKQTVSVSFPVCFTQAWMSVHVSVYVASFLYVCMFGCHGVYLLPEARLQSKFCLHKWMHHATCKFPSAFQSWKACLEGRFEIICLLTAKSWAGASKLVCFHHTKVLIVLCRSVLVVQIVLGQIVLGQ